MIQLKKTALATMLLSSGVAFSGTMGPVCVPGSVNTPCSEPGWSVAGRALLLQPSLSNAAFAYDDAPLFTTTSTGANSQARWQGTTNSWLWGFELDAGYQFGKGRDANLSWYRYHNSAAKTVSANTHASDGSVTFNSVANDTLTVKPQWDAVNFELGQRVDFQDLGESVRFHGGVQYARIATGFNGVVSSVHTWTRNSNSSYNGFGPRAGLGLYTHLDSYFQALSGFDLYGTIAGSVLAGPSSFNSTLTDVNGIAYAHASHMAIVPELDTKLGVAYAHQMAQGQLGVDVGWLWLNYFNAQQHAFNAATSSTTVTYNAPRESDFGAQGLYFGLQWQGNV